MNKEEAMEQISEIISGFGIYRLDFPDSMKGSFALKKWNDDVFILGMEYGYILSLMTNFQITEKDLKDFKERKL